MDKQFMIWTLYIEHGMMSSMKTEIFLIYGFFM